jgi:plasmid stabilization system protein ParE
VTYRVILQPRAESDILEAARWIEHESRSTAKALRWVRGIRAQIDTLKANPRRCPVDPDSKAYGEEVRMLLHGKPPGTYRILFAIRGAAVHILTVRHSARRNVREELGLDDVDEDGAAP